MAVREHWRSGLGFVLAAAGSAVGLGNLWGFAYRASQGGGGAFVLLYLVIVVIICLPLLVAEMVLGRSTGHSPLIAPITAGGRLWAPLGWLFLIVAVGILSYYSVLMGWTGHSLLHVLFNPLPADMPAAESYFSEIKSGSNAVLGHLISLGLTGAVVAAGVRAGIERLTRWGMPLLFVLLLGLLIWASFLSGAQEGYATFLLNWDSSKLIDPATISNAFTQAFFSIGTGIGAILAYAAYLDRRSSIPNEAVAVVGMDTAVGLMAGCVTFPIVASFGLGGVVDADPFATFFISLPYGLASQGLAGRVVVIVFFALVYIAAITSAISLLEVPASSLMDRLGWRRRQAVWACVALIAVIGVPSALDTAFLARMDLLFASICMPASGLALALLMGWHVPQRYLVDLAPDEMMPAELRGYRSYEEYHLLLALRWVSTPAIAVGLVISIFNVLGKWSG